MDGKIFLSQRLPTRIGKAPAFGKIDVPFLCALFASFKPCNPDPDTDGSFCLAEGNLNFDPGLLCDGLNWLGLSLACISLVTMLVFVAYPPESWTRSYC
jgi:hypothetical protein